MKTIKYTGSEKNWDELSVTGNQSVWYPGWTDIREDAEADLLIATGFFSRVYPDSPEALNARVTALEIAGPGGGGITDGDKGDITVTGGVWVVDANVITNAKSADMANSTIKGRSTAGTGDPEDLTPTQVRAILNVASGATANSSDATLLNRANHTGTQGGDTVTFDPTDLKVLTATDQQALGVEIDAALFRARATGVITGGALSGEGTATITIAAGSGSIVNSAAGTHTPVSWAQANFSPVGLSWIYADTDNALHMDTTEPTSDQWHTRIYLYRVAVNGGVVTGYVGVMTPLQNDGQRISDLHRFLGPLKSGQVVAASGANLKLAISAGSITGAGVGWPTDKNAPDEAPFPAFDTAGASRFKMATSSGLITTDITDLPVASYQVGGSVVAVPTPTTRHTIFTVYRFGSGNVRIAYGNAYYSDAEAALVALNTYVPSVPASFSNAIILGYIIAPANATNLTTSGTFVATNQFGGLGGGVGVVSGSGSGTVTSVAMSVPTGLSVAGSPITGAGTLAVTLAAGYVIPTQATIDDKVSSSAATTISATKAVLVAADKFISIDSAASNVPKLTTLAELNNSLGRLAPGTALGTTGTVNLDLAALANTDQQITATGNITITTSNRAAGLRGRLRIAAGAATRTLTWPSWAAFGAALPTSLASGKVLRVAWECTGTTDASVDAVAVESV